MISLPQQTVELARRLAVAQHRSVEEAIRVAIEEKARRRDRTRAAPTS